MRKATLKLTLGAIGVLLLVWSLWAGEPVCTLEDTEKADAPYAAILTQNAIELAKMDYTPEGIRNLTRYMRLMAEVERDACSVFPLRDTLRAMELTIQSYLDIYGGKLDDSLKHMEEASRVMKQARRTHEEALKRRKAAQQKEKSDD